MPASASVGRWTSTYSYVYITSDSAVKIWPRQRLLRTYTCRLNYYCLHSTKVWFSEMKFRNWATVALSFLFGN